MADVLPTLLVIAGFFISVWLVVRFFFPSLYHGTGWPCPCHPEKPCDRCGHVVRSGESYYEITGTKIHAECVWKEPKR